LINAGRSIIYAGKEQDFAEKARAEALALQQAMDAILTNAGI
ncbi:MAG: orotidine 5'-phosphate decarboxylase, partial [Pedobacter sp.]